MLFSTDDLFAMAGCLAAAALIDKTVWRKHPVQKFRAWRESRREDFSDWDEADRATPVYDIAPDGPRTLTHDAIYTPARVREEARVKMPPPSDAGIYAAAVRQRAQYAVLSDAETVIQPAVRPEPVMLQSAPAAPVTYESLAAETDAWIAEMKARSHRFMIDLIGADRLAEIEAEKIAAEYASTTA